jgi:fibronectin type III domain protein
MISARSLTPFALVLLSLGFTVSPAEASSFVAMTDEALVDQAPAAAVVRILGVDAGAGSRDGAAWATEYRVQVEQRLKGQLPASVLRVWVIGGSGPDGLSLHVYGAPRFAAGERVLLLLQPIAGGAFRPVQLFLGAFHEVSSGGRRFAVRDLSQANEVRVSVDGTAKAGPAQPDRLRDFDAFARWIASRAANLAGASYWVNEKFTFFSDPDDHLNLRWFVFDGGGHVDWKAYTTGQKGVPGGGYAQFQAGLAAWTAEPQTPIDYRYAGLTDSSSALDQADGVNAIVFNDPNNLIAPFSCSAGGVLAIGGPFYTTATHPFQGQAFHQIVEGDIVISNGLECFFAQSPNAAKAAEEVFGHELGHTLGLGHSCGDSRSPACLSDPAFDAALMRAFVHNDGRGAELGTDDQAGVRSLYGTAAAPPAAPSHLAASVTSPTEVRLTWTDESTDETEFRVEIKPPDAGFEDVGAVAADSFQALIQGLQPATGYAFRVRASRSGSFSDYSNVVSLATDAPPGPCVATGTALCIHGRFQVSVAWKASVSAFGAGQVMPVSSADSGLFWFTSPDNLELLVKVLDGCPLNQRFWVYTGPATDAQLTLTVIDTKTGKVRVYVNPLGMAAGTTTDTEAFATCP